MAGEAKADDIAYLTALVRAKDRPRYYAALFSPYDIRDDLFAIYGFAAEIARVPDQVSDPALGEIRLRWWQDSLAAMAGQGGEPATPALRALSAAIARHRLPSAAFAALIEARGTDLYSDPPATLTDVEGLMGETESVLFQMAAIASGAAGPETADAAGHAGIAYGVARRLSAFASARARGRTILPAELLASEGISAQDVFVPSARSGAHRTVAALSAFARRHLDIAHARIAYIPAPLQLAFLPLAVVDPLLNQVERLGPAIAERDAGLSNLESLTRIGWARWRRRDARPEKRS